MNALTAALKEELNVEMVSVFGLSIPESVVVSWGIMAFLVLGSILLTRNLRVEHITKRQAVLETVVTTINDFFVGLLGENGKRYERTRSSGRWYRSADWYWRRHRHRHCHR